MPLLHALLRRLVLLGCAAVAAACADAPEPDASAGFDVGATLPDFEAPLLQGGTVSLAEYRGAPLLVNLWATWCAPCQAEMPYLEAVGREYAPRGLRIVGISTDREGAIDEVRRVVDRRGVTYDILLDPDARSTELFDVFGLPVSVLADAQGRVTWMREGPIPEGDPEFLEALLGLIPPSGDTPEP